MERNTSLLIMSFRWLLRRGAMLPRRAGLDPVCVPAAFHLSPRERRSAHETESPAARPAAGLAGDRHRLQRVQAATDTAVRKNESASPSPPVEQPLAKPAPVTPSAVAQDQRTGKTDRLVKQPAPSASGQAERQLATTPAPPAVAEIAAMSYNAQSAKRMAYMPMPILLQPMPGDINRENY